MTKKQKTLALVGGAALAAVAVGAYVYNKSQSGQLPGGGSAPPLPTLTAVTTLSKGKNYGFTAQLPNNVTDQNTLVAGLEGTGWTNVQVQFFGPAASGNQPTPPAGLPFTIPVPLATAYVASGTWTGADGAPVGANVSAVQVS